MTSDDATILAEALGEERAKNKQLRRDFDNLGAELRTARKGRKMAHFFGAAGGAVVGLFIVFGLGWLIWHGFMGGPTDKCYIKPTHICGPGFSVIREVEWGSDTEVSESTDLETAKLVARKQGCRLPPDMTGGK